MEIKVNITPEILQTAVEKAVLETLEKSYSNPVRDAVEAEMKELGGSIKTLVKGIIASAIEDDSFKESLKKAVVEKIIINTLKG